mgnify:CR=1 FL=1
MKATIEEDPTRNEAALVVRAQADELVSLTVKYAGVVLDRIVEKLADDIIASAAVQARIHAIRAELPVRIEQAVAAAITAAVLAPWQPTSRQQAFHDDRTRRKLYGQPGINNLGV